MESKKIVEQKIFALSSEFAEECLQKDQTVPLQSDTRIENQFRSVFDRDRDRIMYSRAFRRLNGKTQIFIPNTNDYIRTRLTHSLEVNQIARSIGKGLGLNLSLIEAIALGHDVGHTPFGHAGEYELNRIMNNCYTSAAGSSFATIGPEQKGYKHNFQALRVLCALSDQYDQGGGLGLTSFTLWGILNHTKTKTKPCEFFQESVKTWIPRFGFLLTQEKARKIEQTTNGIKRIDFDTLPIKQLYISSDPSIITDPQISDALEQEIENFAILSTCHHKTRKKECSRDGNLSLDFYDAIVKEKTLDQSAKSPLWSFEGIVVAIADEIAQIHHDIEDSIYMGIISLQEAKEFINETFETLIDNIDNQSTSENFQSLLKGTQSASHIHYFMSYASKLIVDFLVSDIIRNSQIEFERLSENHNIESEKDFREQHPIIWKYIGLSLVSQDVLENNVIQFDEHKIMKRLQKKFTNRVINSEEVQKLNNLGSRIIYELFLAFYENPKILPDGTIFRIANHYKEGRKILSDYSLNRQLKPHNYESRRREALGSVRNDMAEILADVEDKKDLMRIICDHIAGMTDKYALAKHQEIYGTNFGL